MFCLNRWLNEYNELTLFNNKFMSKLLESVILRNFGLFNIIVYLYDTTLTYVCRLGNIFRIHFYILRLMGFRFYQYFFESSATSFDYIRNRTTLQSHFTRVLKFTLVAKNVDCHGVFRDQNLNQYRRILQKKHLHDWKVRDTGNFVCPISYR